MARRARLVDLYHGPVDEELVGVDQAGGRTRRVAGVLARQARAAEAAGCDVVVVRGTEGGGRMHGSLPLRPLLDEVIAARRHPGRRRRRRR